ncbi:MAG TPA: prolipoprotein diacylglyceryl transferase family protein [Streptosporangiaceae bacterium]
MPLASLPGPPSGQWHLGPVSVHGYALCVALGVLAAVLLAERRYRAGGGHPWLVLDLATIAVPAGLAGARLYRVVTDYQRYFGHNRDWVNILRIWDGGLGLPGAAAAGLAVTLIWCRRSGTGAGPVLSAVVPGLALGQAIAVLGNWFSQSLYGPPSGLPWAVEIAPRSRVPGYQGFGSFQPLFLYESVWDILVALALVRLIRARRLTGRQALAVLAALYAIGRLGTMSFSLTAPPHSGVLTGQVAAIALVVAAAVYLYLTRSERGPEPLTMPLTMPAARPRWVRRAAGATVSAEQPSADPVAMSAAREAQRGDEKAQRGDEKVSGRGASR